MGEGKGEGKCTMGAESWDGLGVRMGKEDKYEGSKQKQWVRG